MMTKKILIFPLTSVAFFTQLVCFGELQSYGDICMESLLLVLKNKLDLNNNISFQ